MLRDLKSILLMRGSILLLSLLASPWALGQDVPPVIAPVPVRFLLTFDDGPSGTADRNPTASILDQLADNPIQAPIKAIFFVQTRDRRHGGSEIGQRLLRRLRDEGHQLAVHSGTARGHINHTQMPLEELEQSLNDGSEDIRALTGVAPRLVRPPYWDFTNATLDAYARNHLRMLMYDIRVNDGKSGGINYTWRLRVRVASEMRRMRALIKQGVVPVVGDTIPLIVAFHDTNRHTAKNLQVYMQLLIEEAGKQGLAVAPKPFFDDVAEVGEMALARTPDFLKWANASGLGRRHP